MLALLARTLGQPDYNTSTQESIDPTAVFSKLVADGVRKACRDGLALDAAPPRRSASWCGTRRSATPRPPTPRPSSRTLAYLALRFWARPLRPGRPGHRPLRRCSAWPPPRRRCRGVAPRGHARRRVAGRHHRPGHRPAVSHLLTRARDEEQPTSRASASRAARCSPPPPAAIGTAAVGHFGFPPRRGLAPAGLRALLHLLLLPRRLGPVLFLDPRDPVDFPDAERGRTLIETRYNDLGGFSGFLLAPRAPGRPPQSPLVFGPPPPSPTTRKITGFASRMAIVPRHQHEHRRPRVGYRYFLTSSSPRGAAARTNVALSRSSGRWCPAARCPTSRCASSPNDRHPGGASAVRVDSINDLLLLLRPSSYQERDVVEAGPHRLRPAHPGRATSRWFNPTATRLSAMRDARSRADQIVRERLASTFRVRHRHHARSRRKRTVPLQLRPRRRGLHRRPRLRCRPGRQVGHDPGRQRDDRRRHRHPLRRQHRPRPAALPGHQRPRRDVSDLERTVPAAQLPRPHHRDVLLGFSRTPLYNNFNGRDHHISNSLPHSSAPVSAGNTVFGASSNIGMAPTAGTTPTTAPPTAARTSSPSTSPPPSASAGLDPYITRVEAARAVLRT